MKYFSKAFFLGLIAVFAFSSCEKESFDVETTWIPEQVANLPPFETASTINLTGETVDAQPLSIIEALYPGATANVQTYASHFDLENQSTAAIFNNGIPETQIFRLIYPESNGSAQNGSSATQNQFAIVKYEEGWEMGIVQRGRSNIREINTILRADFNTDTLHRVDAQVQQYDAAGLAIEGSFTPITLFSRRLEQLQDRDSTFVLTFVRNPVKIATFYCEGGVLDGQSYTMPIPFDFNQLGSAMGVLSNESEDADGNFLSDIDVTYDKELGIYVPVRDNDLDYMYSLDQAASVARENATLGFVPESSTELRFSDWGIFTFGVDTDGKRTLSKLTRIREGFCLQTIRAQEANADRFQTFLAPMDEGRVLGHLDRN